MIPIPTIAQMVCKMLATNAVNYRIITSRVNTVFVTQPKVYSHKIEIYVIADSEQGATNCDASYRGKGQ